MDGQTNVFPLSECRNANARIDPLVIQDLTKLTHINDAAVLDFLKVRYVNNHIYVRR